jgi:hypothetical protein
MIGSHMIHNNILKLRIEGYPKLALLNFFFMPTTFCQFLFYNKFMINYVAYSRTTMEADENTYLYRVEYCGSRFIIIEHLVK